MQSSLQILFTTRNTNFNNSSNLKSVISEDKLMNIYKKIFFKNDNNIDIYECLKMIYIIKQINQLSTNEADKQNIVNIMTDKLGFNINNNINNNNNFNTVDDNFRHQNDENNNTVVGTAKFAIYKIMKDKLGFNIDDDNTNIKYFNTVDNKFRHQEVETQNTFVDTVKFAILTIVHKYILPNIEYNYDTISTIDISQNDDSNYFNKYDTIYNYMKFMEKSTNKLSDIIYNVACNVSSIEVFFKVYFLLNNIEILFLCNTFDYKLMMRILNRNNFISDENYKKACFIAMIVFELWSLVNNTQDIVFNNQIGNDPFYHNFYDSVFVNDTEAFKRCQKIHNLLHEIKNDARLFASNNDLIENALIKNAFEIEIPKRNLDNIIKPLNNIPEQQKNIEFDFHLTPIKDKYNYSSSILPNSINGGVRRIKGGDEQKLKELQDSYDKGKFYIEDGNKQFDQTRFLFDCLITANEKGATKCLNTLSISTVKVESYKIVETLPRATLIKLATVLGIQFSNGKIETYSKWIERIKSDNEFSFTDMLDADGEVKLIGRVYDKNTHKEVLNNPDGTIPTNAAVFDILHINKETYRKLLIIHYIGNIIIDKLGGKNVEYDILRAQNKAKVQFTKITGPEVSYRTKSNFTNFRSNSRSLSLSSNPIFMTMNLYQQQSPEQIDRIKSGIMNGGAPDAQLYSSNIYEKAITQALNKYRSMGFKINPDDMNIINQTIEQLKDVEVRILDTYSSLMSVLQFSTMRNNYSFMASLSKEEQDAINNAWDSKDSNKIIELKKKLDNELKEKQVLADNAKTILDVIFPWKKSLDSLVEKVESIDKKLPTQP